MLIALDNTNSFVLIIITQHVAYRVETETVNNISTNSRVGKVKDIMKDINFNIQIVINI